ncbi:hypothetical protein [Mycolicibacterium baixiangningiae]|uniref:hypothetical protein n=1 Tax=Mycolicibacterium baixiangningiae TaxID=2761578 RepID=UPI0018693B8E|nr:hypothetical protein [Mycolicibacterium baixiangningiae]
MPDADVTFYRADTVLTLTGNEFDGPGGVVVQDGIIRAVFVDPHAHAELAAKATFGMADVRAPGCRSVVDVLDTLRAILGRAKDGWVVAQANLFFDQKLADRECGGATDVPRSRAGSGPVGERVRRAADAHRRRRVCARRGRPAAARCWPASSLI